MAVRSEKQRAFVQEYIIDFDGTKAAIRAGYSARTARQIASELMQKQHIKDAIAKEIAKRSRRTGITADRVLLELAKVAFLNSTDVINMDEATVQDEAKRDDTAAIASVKVKRIPTEEGDIIEREVKTYDKLKALELLGKHLGLFNDNLKVSGEVAVKIVDDIPDGAEEDDD